MSKETFIKALENYFLLEQNPGLRQKHHVSTLLNSTNEPIDKIQERFNFFFSYTGSSRVKKYLDLIEFLSIHSPDKIIDAINTDKFVETIAAALMESEFQDTVCNLFRIWYDRYDVDRGRASKVLDMADNLANFGFNIPYNYKSKYEGIDIEAELAKLPEKKDESQGEKFPKVEIENRAGAEVFLSKADAVRDKAHGLLVNHNLAKMSDQTKKETVQSLGDEIKTLLAYKIAKTNTLDAEIRENIENAISALQRFLGELKEYGVKEEEESTSYGTYPRVYGPEPQPESWRNGYKDNESRQFPNMLSPDELMKYKTEPCEDQMRCKHAPKSRKGFQIGSLSKEIYCTGWHGMQDRRRQVLDEKGHTMYKFSMCNKKDECRNGDNCRKAHNFFEAFFHPMNYKSKRCAMVTVCKHGKYCPYFHSTEEKEHWVRVLKERFNFRSDDTYVDEPDLWGEDSNVTYSGMYENVMKHMPAGAAIPMEDMRSSSVNERTDYNEKKSYEPKAEILDIPSQKPKDKELCSTLVIRKRYVEPGKLTKPLYSNPCFYGVPLAVIGTQDLKEIYVPGKEQMNVAVIEDGKQVKENK